MFPSTASFVAHRGNIHDLGLQVAKTVNERISKYAQVTLESCAYAGTGNVLKVQQLLAQAGEHIELKEDESWKVRQTVSTQCWLIVIIIILSAASWPEQSLLSLKPQKQLPGI